MKLLDRSSDLDHNRTVLTFAGSIVGVEEAAFAIKTAAELIDLEVHMRASLSAQRRGSFVPLSGATMDDCIAIAKGWPALEANSASSSI